MNVVEYGPGVSTAFAGWLLAELGASVSYLPKPPALAEKLPPLSPAAAYFIQRTSHRKAQIEPGPAGAVLPDDAIVLSAFEKDDVRRDLGGSPSIVSVASSTRPDWEIVECLEDDMRLWARSGLASLSRALTDSGGYGHISFPTNFQPSLLAGEAAAIAAVSIGLARLGGGPPICIEFDKLELLATLPMQPIATAQIEGRVVGDLDAAAYPGGVIEALDGKVYVRPVEPTHWKRLLELVGDMEWASLEALSDRRFLLEARELIDGPLKTWVASRTKENIVEAAQARHIPLAPLNRPADVLDDRHLLAREFFGSSGGPKDLSVPWVVESKSRHRTSPNGNRRPGKETLPLSGLRILDLTWAWAGPFATTVLADLGADVINVEWDPRASNMRTQPPFAASNETSTDASGWWSSNQRGKLSVGVNLKSIEGQRIIRELAAVSDAAIENFSPGVVDRLGIGFRDLQDVNETLVYVSMSAFGKSGPNSHFVGYGPHLFASAGCAFAFGHESVPTQMLIPYADPVSGMAGALALVAYIFGARASDSGAAIDVSDLEATTLIMADVLLRFAEGRPPVEDPPEPIVLHSRIGRSIAVFVPAHGGRSRAASALKAHDDSVGSLVEAAWWMQSDEICMALDHDQLAWAWVQNCAEVLLDADLKRANFWIADQSPELARADARIGAPFWRVNGERARIRCGAPLLFSDTRSVLNNILCYDADRIDSLTKGGAIKERSSLTPKEVGRIATKS
ncbi:MAG: CoA transferase [Chloroflexi bacterium]|nr:CoA transferase [Chloroflexota bacterium]